MRHGQRVAGMLLGLCLCVAGAQAQLDAPTGLSPCGVETQTNMPTFSWEPVAGAEWYQVVITQNQSPYFSWWTQETSAAAWWEMAVGTYGWQVQGWGTNDGIGPLSDACSFTVPGPGTAAPIAPTGGGQIETNPPTFEWEPAARAQWYYLYVEMDGAYYFDTWTQETTYTPWWGAFEAGEYTWYVQTWGGGAFGDWSAAADFSVVPGPPDTAVPGSPVGGITVENPVVFEWDTANNAQWYYLYVEMDGAYYFDIWTQDTRYDTYWDFDSGSYTWYLQTWGNGEFGDWSAAAEFQVQGLQPPPPATLLGPIDSPDVLLNPPTFQWEPAADAEWYQIRVVQDGSDLFSEWTQATSFTPQFPLPDGAYEWYIQGWNAAGLGDWSQPGVFSIPGGQPTIPSLAGRWGGYMVYTNDGGYVTGQPYLVQDYEQTQGGALTATDVPHGHVLEGQIDENGAFSLSGPTNYSCSLGMAGTLVEDNHGALLEGSQTLTCTDLPEESGSFYLHPLGDPVDLAGTWDFGFAVRQTGPDPIAGSWIATYVITQDGDAFTISDTDGNAVSTGTVYGDVFLSGPDYPRFEGMRHADQLSGSYYDGPDSNVSFHASPQTTGLIAPAFTSPQPGAVVEDGMPEFCWEEDPNAEYYWLKLTDATGGYPFEEWYEAGTTCAQLTEPLAPGVYHAGVIAWSAEHGLGPHTDTPLMFTVPGGEPADFSGTWTGMAGSDAGIHYCYDFIAYEVVQDGSDITVTNLFEPGGAPLTGTVVGTGFTASADSGDGPITLTGTISDTGDGVPHVTGRYQEPIIGGVEIGWFDLMPPPVGAPGPVGEWDVTFSDSYASDGGTLEQTDDTVTVTETQNGLEFYIHGQDTTLYGTAVGDVFSAEGTDDAGELVQISGRAELDYMSGTYWWHGTDTHGCGYFDGQAGGSGDLIAPAITSPQPGTAIDDGMPQFCWETDPNAENYRLVVSDATGSMLVDNWYDVDTHCATLASPLDPGFYIAYVQTWSAAEGMGPWPEGGLSFSVPGGEPVEFSGFWTGFGQPDGSLYCGQYLAFDVVQDGTSLTMTSQVGDIAGTVFTGTMSGPDFSVSGEIPQEMTTITLSGTVYDAPQAGPWVDGSYQSSWPGGGETGWFDLHPAPTGVPELPGEWNVELFGATTQDGTYTDGFSDTLTITDDGAGLLDFQLENSGWALQGHASGGVFYAEGTDADSSPVNMSGRVGVEGDMYGTYWLRHNDESDACGNFGGYRALPDLVIPDITSPQSGAVIDDGLPEFCWTEDPNTEYYRLYIADGAGAAVYEEWYEAGTTCAQVTDPLGPGSYEAFVQSWAAVPGFGPFPDAGLPFSVPGDDPIDLSGVWVGRHDATTNPGNPDLLPSANGILEFTPVQDDPYQFTVVIMPELGELDQYYATVDGNDVTIEITDSDGDPSTFLYGTYDPAQGALSGTYEGGEGVTGTFSFYRPGELATFEPGPWSLPLSPAYDCSGTGSPTQRTFEFTQDGNVLSAWDSTTETSYAGAIYGDVFVLFHEGPGGDQELSGTISPCGAWISGYHRSWSSTSDCETFQTVEGWPQSSGECDLTGIGCGYYYDHQGTMHGSHSLIVDIVQDGSGVTMTTLPFGEVWTGTMDGSMLNLTGPFEGGTLNAELNYSTYTEDHGGVETTHWDLNGSYTVTDPTGTVLAEGDMGIYDCYYQTPNINGTWAYEFLENSNSCGDPVTGITGDATITQNGNDLAINFPDFGTFSGVFYGYTFVVVGDAGIIDGSISTGLYGNYQFDTGGCVRSGSVSAMPGSDVLPPTLHLWQPYNGSEISAAQNPPTFQWESVSNVDYYRLHVDTADGTEYLREDVYPSDGSALYVPTEPLPPGSYEAWVRGFNGTGMSPDAPHVSFTVLE